jgi:hypothetical protein
MAVPLSAIKTTASMETSITHHPEREYTRGFKRRFKAKLISGQGFQ